MTETPDLAPQPNPIVNTDRPKRKRTLLWLTLIFIILAIIWFFYWLLFLQFHRYTDDAYANGNMVNINSVVQGSVIAFYADDTDLVEEGQLLVSLDPTQYQVEYENELAALVSTVLQVLQIYDNVQVSQANVEGKKTNYSRAQYDYENRKKLVESKSISEEDFVHARDEYKRTEFELALAKSQLQSAIDAVSNAPIEHHPLIEQQKGRVRLAYYHLKHTSIYAPSTGYIAQRFVDVGQWVTNESNLMAIIPNDYVWVDANFKETQLTNMRIGQPARVWFDLYGSKVEYQGKVLGIASGSGSVFSIIPPQNATGNWIKILQRLPVRISLDAKTLEKYPSRLGITAEVDVDITDQNLPMLAQDPSTKAISTTNIFDIHIEEVNKVMDEIINSNVQEWKKNTTQVGN